MSHNAEFNSDIHRMKHYVLLFGLMNRKYPIQLLIILEKWFAVTVTCVKWNEHMSIFILLNVGARQGGVLPPGGHLAGCILTWRAGALTSAFCYLYR